MEFVLRYFWIVFVLATYLNGRRWWNRAQKRIQTQPDLESGYRRLYRGYIFWGNVPWIVMGLGILSGSVPSMLNFLHPSDGNIFVLAWWGLMAAILILGTYWMLFGGGAEMLERHPGVYMVPHWPAAKLRIFWLGTVAWNVLIGTLLFPTSTENSYGRARHHCRVNGSGRFFRCCSGQCGCSSAFSLLPLVAGANWLGIIHRLRISQVSFSASALPNLAGTSTMARV